MLSDCPHCQAVKGAADVTVTHQLQQAVRLAPTNRVRGVVLSLCVLDGLVWLHREMHDSASRAVEAKPRMVRGLIARYDHPA
jgi:hypothetical protein